MLDGRNSMTERACWGAKVLAKRARSNSDAVHGLTAGDHPIRAEAPRLRVTPQEIVSDSTVSLRHTHVVGESRNGRLLPFSRVNGIDVHDFQAFALRCQPHGAKPQTVTGSGLTVSGYFGPPHTTLPHPAGAPYEGGL
jgi:hypothetical protein